MDLSLQNGNLRSTISKAIDPLQDIKDGSVDDINFPDSTDHIKTEEPSEYGKVDPQELKCEVKDETEEECNNDIELELDEDDNDLKCLVCKEFFFNRHALMNHGCVTVSSAKYDEDMPLKRFKKKFESFACEMCDFSAKNPKFLLAHVKNIHKSTKTVNCTECDETFKSLQKLRCHMIKMHKESIRQEKCLCTLCGKTLRRSNLKKHEREKHGVDNAKFIRKDKIVKIQCSKCEESFESAAGLNDHVITCIGESRKARGSCPAHTSD